MSKKWDEPRDNDTYNAWPACGSVPGIPDRMIGEMFAVKTKKGWCKIGNKIRKTTPVEKHRKEEEKAKRAAALARQIELHHNDPNYECDYNEHELAIRLAKRIMVMRKTGK